MLRGLGLGFAFNGSVRCFQIVRNHFEVLDSNPFEASCLLALSRARRSGFFKLLLLSN